MVEPHLGILIAITSFTVYYIENSLSDGKLKKKLNVGLDHAKLIYKGFATQD